jgi:hypothetical protein
VRKTSKGCRRTSAVGGKADVMFDPGRLGLNGNAGCRGSTGVTPLALYRGLNCPTPWGSTGTTAVGARRSMLTYVEKVRPQFLSLRQFAQGRVFSRRSCWQLSPVVVAISNSSSGLPTGITALLFSETPVSLRTSVLRRFHTVLEIRSFRVTYELQRERGSAASLG